jgi:hypothetical protein
MAESRRFRSSDEADVICGSRMIRVNFNLDASVTLRLLRGDFNTREIQERIRGSRPASASTEMNTHVGSELGEKVDAKISTRVKTGAGPRKEQPKELDVLRRRAAENTVDQEAPSVQVAHVHKGCKSSCTENSVGNSACNETGKLNLDSVETTNLAGKAEGVASRMGKPIMKATAQGFKNLKERSIRTGVGRGQSFDRPNHNLQSEVFR